MLKPVTLTEEQKKLLQILIAKYHTSSEDVEKISEDFHWHELIYNREFLRVLFEDHIRLSKRGVGVPYYFYILDWIGNFDPDKKIEFIYREYFNPTFIEKYIDYYRR